MRTLAVIAGLVLAAACLAGPAEALRVLVRDVSLDTPLVLDANVHYRLEHVTVAGVTDGAAITLAGRIASVEMQGCSFGRVWAGNEGRAVGLDAAGAMVDRILAVECSFFDSENQLVSLREGSFGLVTFERCRFSTSDSFMKQVREGSPWRDWPPATEFYNIQRLELFDNQFVNTTIIIHPSVRQVVIRGEMPGLQVINPQATRVIRLDGDDQLALR
jgi:hypothetical protein